MFPFQEVLMAYIRNAGQYKLGATITMNIDHTVLYGAECKEPISSPVKLAIKRREIIEI